MVVAGHLEQDLAKPQRLRPLQHQGERVAREALAPAILLADHDAEVGGAAPAVDPGEVGETDQASRSTQLDGKRQPGRVDPVRHRAQPSLGLAGPERRVAPQRASSQLLVLPPGDDARQVGLSERPEPDTIALRRASARGRHWTRGSRIGSSHGNPGVRVSRRR
jgi:hypothetical protein